MVKPQKKQKALGIRRNAYVSKIRMNMVRRQILQDVSRRQTTDFFWVIGHGIQLSSFSTVPSNTYIVFLQAPGLLTLKAPVLHRYFYGMYDSEHVMRQFIQGKLSPELTPPYSVFETCFKRIYLPGERYPNVYLEFFDKDDPAYDKVAGVKHVGAMFRRYHHHADGTGVKTTLSTVIKNRPGIYFVSACRGTVYQAPGRLFSVGMATRGSPSATPATNVVGAANTIRRREAKLGRPVIRRVVRKRPARVIKKIRVKK